MKNMTDEKRLTFEPYKPEDDCPENDLRDAVYKRNGRTVVWSSDPLASISKSSTLRFNKAAILKFDLNAKTCVCFYYSEEIQALAMKKVEPGCPGAVQFFDRKHPSVGISRVIKQFGLMRGPVNHRQVSYDSYTQLIIIHAIKQLGKAAEQQEKTEPDSPKVAIGEFQSSAERFSLARNRASRSLFPTREALHASIQGRALRRPYGAIIDDPQPGSAIDPDKAYTIEQIASAAGVSKSTINTMRKNGLPSRKFGRRVLVIGQDYLNYQKP